MSLWKSVNTPWSVCQVGDFAELGKVCAIRNGQFVNIYARTRELEQKCGKGLLSLSLSICEFMSKNIDL